MNATTTMHPASALARAAGISRQAVYEALKAIAPAGRVNTKGQTADAWPFSALPLSLQEPITRRAIKAGFPNGEEYLAQLPAEWTAPKPWNEVSQPHRDKAAKLHKAIARALQLHSDAKATAAEVEAAGLEDFKAAFGYTITTRHFRRLLHRTLTRDAGADNWQRLEIYLDERAFLTPKAAPQIARLDYLHRPIDETIAALENRIAPTARDRQFLWDAVFRHYETQTAAFADTPAGNRQRRKFKASLLFYLFKAFPSQTLCASADALKRRFDEKLDAWRAGGRTLDALEDRRPSNSGNHRTPDFSADLKLIRNEAIRLDGNESLAHLTLRERGQLSQAFCDYYPFDSRQNKSALPYTVRQGITPQVNMTLPLLHGEWSARMAGPYISRDWSNVKPGDWFTADDVTWNHHYKEQLPDGRWQILRGECLLMVDLRTGYPLFFLMVAGKYNGEHIKALELRVHDDLGLPHLGFFYEQGVFASRIVTNGRKGAKAIKWREQQTQLRNHRLNIESRHATTPRAKTIEGLLNILQNRMAPIFGYVGKNEREDNFERIQLLKVRAERGDPAALAKFQTGEEWRDQIRNILEEYKHSPQNGKMLEGKSPAEAWSAAMLHRPLRQLAPEDRFIFADYESPAIVKQEGIIITIRGKRRLYCGEDTGALIGQQITAFYNVELPDLITCFDLKSQNHFSARRISLPAMDATVAQLAEVRRAIKGHMATQRVIYGELTHETRSTVTRSNEQNEESKSLGRFRNAEVEKFKTEKSARSRTLGKVARCAAQQGITVPDVRDPDEALEALDRREYYKRQMEAEAAVRAGTADTSASHSDNQIPP